MWCDIESFIGEELPKCIKLILPSCAYDSITTIKFLSESSISDMEEYIVNEEKHILQKMDCHHSSIYQRQNKFKFSPGHRTLLLVLPNYVTEMCKIRSEGQTDGCQSQEFSVILRELIRTADINAKRDKNHACYDKIIRFFFAYIYLLCGKNCYETLNRNLPIPSTKTIRKLSICFF